MNNSIHGLIITMVAIVAVFLCRQYLFTFILVKGRSMLDTLHDHDVLFMRRIGIPHRGDIVICHYPNRRRKKFPRLRLCFVKRIVALPGETIAFEEGHVLINGAALDEPYLSDNRRLRLLTREPRTLGADEYFVMGDNRLASTDSRSVGPITRGMIKGIVCARIYPFRSVRRFRRLQ